MEQDFGKVLANSSHGVPPSIPLPISFDWASSVPIPSFVTSPLRPRLAAAFDRGAAKLPVVSGRWRRASAQLSNRWVLDPWIHSEYPGHPTGHLFWS